MAVFPTARFDCNGHLTFSGDERVGHSWQVRTAKVHGQVAVRISAPGAAEKRKSGNVPGNAKNTKP